MRNATVKLFIFIILCGIPATQCVELTANFLTHKQLSIDQAVYVVGSIDKIGQWDVTKALKLSITATGNNWFGSVTVSSAMVLEYKYFISKKAAIDPNNIIYDQQVTYKMNLNAVEDRQTIRPMQFNIRYDNEDDGVNIWNNRKEMVVKVIQDHDCDFVGMQEVLRNQYDYLQEQLSGLTIYGRGREANYLEGEASPFFYNHNRWLMQEGGTFWLSDTPDVPGSTSYGNFLPRICTWGHFNNKLNGEKVMVFSCHLDHRSMESQQLAGQQLKRYMAEHNLPNEHIILLSDFNNGRLSNTYWVLLNNEFKLRNVNENLYLSTFHDWTGNRWGECIDYIMITNQLDRVGFELIRYNENNLYPSDHFPIFAILQRKSATQLFSNYDEEINNDEEILDDYVEETEVIQGGSE